MAKCYSSQEKFTELTKHYILLAQAKDIYGNIVYTFIDNQDNFLIIGIYNGQACELIIGGDLIVFNRMPV